MFGIKIKKASIRGRVYWKKEHLFEGAFNQSITVLKCRREQVEFNSQTNQNSQM